MREQLKMFVLRLDLNRAKFWSANRTHKEIKLIDMQSRSDLAVTPHALQTTDDVIIHNSPKMPEKEHGIHLSNKLK